jgi:GntR family transcriptional regulator
VAQCQLYGQFGWTRQRRQTLSGQEDRDLFVFTLKPMNNLVPLYRDLRATLMAEIIAGKFPVGSRFPTDYELCERFQVSRATVREALRSLQDEGLLVRVPGSGTVVGTLPGAPRYVQTIESIDQLYSAARAARLTVYHNVWVRLGPDIATVLDRPVRERWLRVSGLRTYSGGMQRPSWVDIYVAEPYGSIRWQVTADQPIHQAIEKQFNIDIAAIEVRHSAVILSEAQAKVLKVEPHTAGLQTMRRYLTVRSEPIEISLSIQAGDQPSQIMRFVKTSKKP